MSDQIRSMYIVLITFAIMGTGLVTFVYPTFIGSLILFILGSVGGYNWGMLDKFELNSRNERKG